MERIIALLFSALCVCSGSLPFQNQDTAYVVQIHSSREGFDPTQEQGNGVASISYETQLMTASSGKRYECFVPKEEASQSSGGDGSDSHDLIQPNAWSEAKRDAFLSFARTALKRVQPRCVQMVDDNEEWLYEICPGALIRKVKLKSSESDSALPEDTEEAEQPPQQTPTTEVVELGTFTDESIEPVASYVELRLLGIYTILKRQQKPLFTQYYTINEDASTQRFITVQYICDVTSRRDMVAASTWRSSDAPDFPERFLIASKLFCDRKYADMEETEDTQAVVRLLDPLVRSNTCIKRNEGWWTYEFCFGRSVRQYHRDADGRITAEFSLGRFDVDQNQQLLSSGKALVLEHLDATHDTSRPAFVEMYNDGTFCEEFHHQKPRSTKVFYYCNHGGSTNHILAIKETQTCTYTMKVSTPMICDHPHFMHDEEANAEVAQVIHCVPLREASDIMDSHSEDPSPATASAKSTSHRHAHTEL